MATCFWETVSWLLVLLVEDLLLSSKTFQAVIDSYWMHWSGDQTAQNIQCALASPRKTKPHGKLQPPCLAQSCTPRCLCPSANSWASTAFNKRSWSLLRVAAWAPGKTTDVISWHAFPLPCTFIWTAPTLKHKQPFANKPIDGQWQNSTWSTPKPPTLDCSPNTWDRYSLCFFCISPAAQQEHFSDPNLGLMSCGNWSRLVKTGWDWLKFEGTGETWPATQGLDNNSDVKAIYTMAWSCTYPIQGTFCIIWTFFGWFACSTDWGHKTRTNSDILGHGPGMVSSSCSTGARDVLVATSTNW